uniref:Uncharacterized protein n=1 Tax=Ipomoea trifida TaxID=35884 RepID=A0PAD4_IPOTF|nr:hypothetical protein [Ipomoea trifida]
MGLIVGSFNCRKIS